MGVEWRGRTGRRFRAGKKKGRVVRKERLPRASGRRLTGHSGSGATIGLGEMKCEKIGKLVPPVPTWQKGKL